MNWKFLFVSLLRLPLVAALGIGHIWLCTKLMMWIDKKLKRIP